MVRNQRWRIEFMKRFGFLPDARERERFLQHVSFSDGRFVWRGPETYEIAAHQYDPSDIARTMLGQDVSRGSP